MYKVLGNRVIKMTDNPKMEWDAIVKYVEELDKQAGFPISGNHNWKEGQLIEEGKDFFLQEYSYEVPDSKKDQWATVAIPKQAEPSTGSEEDELWGEIFHYAEIHFGTKWFSYADEFREHLKQSFTIKRK